MTQASSNHKIQSLLDELVQAVRERSARGNATAADWRSIAEIDEDRARRELSRYLATTTTGMHANPYMKQSRAIGTVTGFIAGCLLMAFMWNTGVPWLQDAWAGIDYGPGFATALTYVSTIFLPLGAWLGSRWDRAHRPPSESTSDVPEVDESDGSFEELLQRFTRLQSRGRARVY